jgi:hypothetical protein
MTLKRNDLGRCLPGWTGLRVCLVICMMILAININIRAFAQLSPGPLSRPHSHLEGLKKCSNCHKLGKRDVGSKCLDCHEEIAAMRKGGPGMHSGDDFSECVDCHVEHQGEDFDLIYWPDGPQGFDHLTMGFEKTGKHADLDCRKCHNAKYVVDAGSLKSIGKELGRTYLGLDSACTSCHEDVHRQSESAVRACTDCHDSKGWKPAPLFAHDRTAFPLTGKHQAVDCAKCHVPVGGAEGPSLVFASKPHGTCTDCHGDPHAGALGPDCRQCHVTDGWFMIQGASFDHSKTRYPLFGRHASVTCAGCHGEGRKKPPFANCTDCHSDTHGSVALARPQLMKCENCHTVQGFRPAGYSLTRHDASGFPLVGAHRATPCVACHRPGGSEGESATDLAPDYASCVACHNDPHLGHTEKYSTDTGCVSCHDQNSWRSVAFDHVPTGFILDGRHLGTDCLACHPRSESGVGFRGGTRLCGVCHEDPHRGQFSDRKTPDGLAVACDQCHVTVDWLAEKFDHDRDSSFALKGGHERVACRACHLPLEEGNDRLLHFKPLPMACRDCHTNVSTPGGSSR